MINGLTLFFATVCLMAIPIYLSNGMALLFGGRTPLDFGTKWLDGRPFLGKGKTVKGTLAGILSGTLGSAIVAFLFPHLAAVLGVNYVLYGFLLAAGAMAGDLTGSFVKRRLGLERGTSILLLDQLDFVAGGVAVGLLIFVPSIWHALLLAAFTLSVHKFGNVVAFKTRIKSVPW